jgi:4-hydroxy-tetrahydrodipicolinate synthase
MYREVLMHNTFQAIWVPIVTPFAAGSVDHSALAHLGKHLADQGVTGLVVGATTGEGCSLSLEERQAAFETLQATLGPDFPLVLGICESDTLRAIQAVRDLTTVRPAGLLVTAPPYLRPGQAGLRQHFESVAEATDRPILIYNIPYRTGTNLELETLQALARHPRIVGIKECGASVDRLMRLIHETSLKILIGEDSQFFPALCMGAQGAIAAAAHIRPDLWVRIFNLIQADKLSEARALAVALQPLIRALFAEPNPAPVKAALAAAGLIRPEIRLPLTPASPACTENTQNALAALSNL